MTILGYHRFQSWKVFKEENEDLEKVFTFGFELEVTILNSYQARKSPEELATCLHEKFNDLFVYERDSSIGNGVEIISNPMTWSYFINHLDLFHDLLKTCIEAGFDSHNGNKCGLHVHIGRQALQGKDFLDNAIRESKVIANINFILEWFRDDIFKFSRRTAHSFERWSHNRTDLVNIGNSENLFIDKERIRNISSYDDSGRYFMLNLSNNNTVEFRFLRGTLKWETFFISMNFIKNIVEQSRISNNAISLKQLLTSGLEDEMKQYCEEYCTQRGIDLDTDNRIIFLENVKQRQVQQMNYLDLANSILDE